MWCELDQNGELLVDIPPAGIIHAEARTLPPSMLGLWCDAGKVDKDTTRYVRARAGKCGPNLEIFGSRWTTFEDESCDVVRVKQVGRAYQVLASCGGEGIGWDERITFTLDGRALLKRVDAIENQRPTDIGTLVCRSHRSTPPDDADPDPVVITLLTFDRTFSVSHTTKNGKTYVRGDQYHDVSVRLFEGHDGIVSWSGTWKRKPNMRMVGTLTAADGGDYRYTEKVYDGGRLETTTVSDCAPADGASGEAPTEEPKYGQGNARIVPPAHAQGTPSTPPQADQRQSLQLVPPALTEASSQFDNFGLSAVNKTVGDVAKAQNNQTAAAQFLAAAKAIGLGPNSTLTADILSDPERSRTIAAALGIGTTLSPEQWRAVHADALAASREPQAARAAYRQLTQKQAAERAAARGEEEPLEDTRLPPMASDPGLPRWLMDEPRAKVRRRR